MQMYLQEMVDKRRTTGLKEERSDLFNNLLDANEHEEDRAAKLSDSALIGTRLLALIWRSAEDRHRPMRSRDSGNVFLFLVAGYEVRVQCDTSNLERG